MDVKDKVALVTGGSRGIGAAIAERLAEGGATVHTFSRSTPSQVSFWRERYGDQRIYTHEVDFSDPAAVDVAVKQVQTISQRVDILVNNAGITRDGLVMRMSDDDWRGVLHVNLDSAFYTTKALARTMIKQRGGSIINISSVVGLTGNGGQANYAASKAGLIGFTKSYAREVASRNIRVNAIAPGFIATEMTEALTEEQRAAMQREIPMGRVGTVEEVANLVLFLASDMSSYITGEVITIGGGMAM